MTDTAILVISALLVFAYLLDVMGGRFKVPSVVLLIGSGILARLLLDRIGIKLQFVETYVPLIGTLGLILIVLEGALDLEIRRDRAGLIARASTAALAGFWLCLLAFAWLLMRLLDFAPATAALIAIPFAVISSAVAIPSTRGLAQETREFVTYESALSDILGVLVFYAWLAAQGSMETFLGDLFSGAIISLAIAVLAALAVFYLINRLEGHVRFLPVLAVLALLYAAGKQLHLSPLILVLVCGLLLNNPQLLEWNARLREMHGLDYDQTLKEFKGVVAELTFATKSFFFLMLGYWTDLSYMADQRAWLIAIVMVAVIYLTRIAILSVLRLPDRIRLLWLAPRGLITVLLFLIAFEGMDRHSFLIGTVMLVVLSTSAITALSHRGITDEPSRKNSARNETATNNTNGNGGSDAAAPSGNGTEGTERPAKAHAAPARRDHH
jgi:cell volume regulation protein A